MERWQNRVAVVTGAASGIGRAAAKDLVTAGFRVVALDLRKERPDENRSKLPEQLQQRLYTQKCDVTNENEVGCAFDWIENTLGGTDVLVNNAGITRPGNLLEMDVAVINEIISTNIRGVIHCTQAAFRSMKSRNFDGHIAHINSIAGHSVMEILPGSSLNIYAVTAINETIRNELRNLGTKIKTTVSYSISPGGARTEIVPPEFWKEYGEPLEPGDVSQAIMFAISTPLHVQIHEITVKPVAERVQL